MRAKRPETYKLKRTINGREIVFEVFVGGKEPEFTSEQQAEFDRREAELITADQALDAAMERKRAARDAWLEIVGTDVGAVLDAQRQRRIVTFVNAPKVNKDRLLELLTEASATDVWSKSVTQQMAATVHFRFDARRSVDALLRALNGYVARYKGFLDLGSVVHETVVDTDVMALLCERRGIEFPEDAFSDRYGVRVYPIEEPLSHSDPD